MFKFVFELLTDPLWLPIDWIYEYIILGVIGVIACRFAYNTVGNLYNSEMIYGRFSGSLFHWIIRLFAFCLLWAIAYGMIWIGKRIIENWQIFLMFTICIIGTAIICSITIFVMRLIKIRKTVDNTNG